MTRGDVTIRGVEPEFLEIALDKVATAGATVDTFSGGFRVAMDRRPTALDIVTLPFPGFATDLLPMALGLAAVSDGASMITENIFDGRFMFVQELVRLGAEIRTDGKHAVVRGRERLSGAPVRATDIRAGAGLVIAALCADGFTEVSHAHHIDRGYPDFVADLRRLGAVGQRGAGATRAVVRLPAAVLTVASRRFARRYARRVAAGQVAAGDPAGAVQFRAEHEYPVPAVDPDRSWWRGCLHRPAATVPASASSAVSTAATLASSP